MLEVLIDKIFLTGSNQKRLLLGNINFTLPSNQIFSIIGKNGSGKTTLIKSLSKLTNDSFFNISGKVLCFSEDLLTISENRLNEIRQTKIKYIFQDALNCFDSLKKLDYYFLLVDYQTEEAENILEYFKLPARDKIAQMYPYELSGGMAQRLMFALALIAKPSLIIMDEPTSGIDVGIANLFLLKMKEFTSQPDHSVLLITQDIDFAIKTGGKIALLKDNTLSEFISADSFLIDDKVQQDKILSSYRELL